MTIRVSEPLPNTSQVPVSAHQAQGHWRNDGEQDDAIECGEPQAVQRIHYVFAEQDPIAGEDLKQRIAVTPSASSCPLVDTIRYCRRWSIDNTVSFSVVDDAVK